MIRVLVATEKPFAAEAREKIQKVFRKAEYELLLLEKYASKNELLAAVAGVEALIIRSDIIDREVIDAAALLKIVVRAGAGFDNVDTGYAARRGIVVMNTPGMNANAVAELAIGLVIYGMRGMFSGTQGSELRGKTLGLHGFGYVARNVFRIARALGMKVIVYTRYSKEAAVAIGLKITHSLEELYHKSDIISIHVPAKGEHLKSVSYDILKGMKENALIVNTARKEIIREEDLLRIMEEKKGVKYLTDVSPDRKEEFAGKYGDRFFSTPVKIGAQTNEANNNAGVAAAEQIVAFFRHGDTSFQVN